MNVTLDQNIKKNPSIPTVSLPHFPFSLQYFEETKTNLDSMVSVFSVEKFLKGSFSNKFIYLSLSFLSPLLTFPHPASIFLSFSFFFIGSHIFQAGLELAIELRMASNF